VELQYYVQGRITGMCLSFKVHLQQILSRDSIAFAHVSLYISFPGLTASFILGHIQYTHFHPTWPFATVIDTNKGQKLVQGISKNINTFLNIKF
jgi:hypothetical protein